MYIIRHIFISNLHFFRYKQTKQKSYGAKRGKNLMFWSWSQPVLPINSNFPHQNYTGIKNWLIMGMWHQISAIMLHYIIHTNDSYMYAIENCLKCLLNWYLRERVQSCLAKYRLEDRNKPFFELWSALSREPWIPNRLKSGNIWFGYKCSDLVGIKQLRTVVCLLNTKTLKGCLYVMCLYDFQEI